jgi:hypothetical protein
LESIRGHQKLVTPDSKMKRVHGYPAVHLRVDELGETGDEGMTSRIEYLHEMGLHLFIARQNIIMQKKGEKEIKQYSLPSGG